MLMHIQHEEASPENPALTLCGKIRTRTSRIPLPLGCRRCMLLEIELYNKLAIEFHTSTD